MSSLCRKTDRFEPGSTVVSRSADALLVVMKGNLTWTSNYLMVCKKVVRRNSFEKQPT